MQGPRPLHPAVSPRQTSQVSEVLRSRKAPGLAPPIRVLSPLSNQSLDHLPNLGLGTIEGRSQPSHTFPVSELRVRTELSYILSKPTRALLSTYGWTFEPL